MDTKGMHYDFKQKINRLDSQAYRNLRPPEIDWHLNEAQLFFIRVLMNPKKAYVLEGVQRSIDDLNTIMVRKTISGADMAEYANRYTVMLPADYMYFVSGEAVLSKPGCCQRVARLFSRRHVDLHERDLFYKSSYEWGEVNVGFEDVGGMYRMVLFTDGDVANEGSFAIDEVLIDYIRRPRDIYYGGYTKLTGTTPENQEAVGCELPEHVHTDVVDIAVMLATGALQLSDYQTKLEKIKLINN